MPGGAKVACMSLARCPRVRTSARNIALTVGMSLAFSLSAADPKRLTGTYALSPASLIDPAPGEQKDTHLRLHLTGAAATDVYRALRSKPKRDECLDDGSLSKTQGEIMCTRHVKGDHECWFGIELKTRKVVGASVC